MGVIWTVLTLALIGWGVLAFASRLASYTGAHATATVKSGEKGELKSEK
jgi:hypothetical protein